MSINKNSVPAGQFKAHCLQLMDYVNEKKKSITITKHGVPVAKLVPIETRPIDLFGALQGNIIIKGDIVAPIDDQWEADE